MPDRSTTATAEALVAAARRAGVRDERVLAAIAAVPREPFLPASYRRRAGEDVALPTTSGQTTSQPSLIASMVQQLQLTGDERVLELGTGPGYQAAILAHLAREVVTVEVVEPLAAAARQILDDLGLDVVVLTAQGRDGAPDHAPFDAAIIAAAAEEVPHALVGQLTERGRVVAPIGDDELQRVVVYEREGDHLIEVARGPAVRFVPLVGPEGP